MRKLFRKGNKKLKEIYLFFFFCSLKICTVCYLWTKLFIRLKKFHFDCKAKNCVSSAPKKIDACPIVLVTYLI